MCSKIIIFFVATLCVVKASVITSDVRAYEDDHQVFNDSEEVGSLRDSQEMDIETANLSFTLRCRPKSCDRGCRLLGYKNGSCADGKCRCIQEDGATEHVQEFSDEEATKNDQEPIVEESEIEESSFERGCNLRECEQRCRRLGFSGGACVNGRCKCDSRMNADLESEIEETSLERRCNLRECEQRCRRLGFSGGACVNGRCKCDSRMYQETDLDTADLTSTDTCWSKICGRVCRILGFKNGSCTDAKCKCVKDEVAAPYSSQAQEPIIEDISSQPEQSQRKCNLAQCKKLCERYTLKGICLYNRCVCRSHTTLEDVFSV